MYSHRKTNEKGDEQSRQPKRLRKLGQVQAQSPTVLTPRRSYSALADTCLANRTQQVLYLFRLVSQRVATHGGLIFRLPLFKRTSVG